MRFSTTHCRWDWPGKCECWQSSHCSKILFFSFFTLLHSFWLLNCYLQIALRTDAQSVLFLFVFESVSIFSNLNPRCRCIRLSRTQWMDNRGTDISDFTCTFWFGPTARCEITFATRNLSVLHKKKACTLSAINIKTQKVVCEGLFMCCVCSAVYLKQSVIILHCHCRMPPPVFITQTKITRLLLLLKLGKNIFKENKKLS